MRINIKKVLELFDEKSPENQGHTNSIISMLGEDLSAAMFMSCVRSTIELKERKFHVAKGFRPGAGPRLDRWFYNKNKKILFQCEIKSWCAWATTAWELKVNAKPREVRKVSNRYWNGPIMKEFKGRKHNKTSKVLMKMNQPEEYHNSVIEPLLILWFPVSAGKDLNPFFSIKTSDLNKRFKTPFKRLHFFSVSLYLRKLYKNGKGKKYLEISMPDTEKRITILKGLGAF